MQNELSQDELEASKEHDKELQEEEELISQAIVDFKLDTISRSELERKAARWMLELDALKYNTGEPLLLKAQRKTSMEFVRFWLSNTLTSENGVLNKLGKVIHKGRSITNTPNAKQDRPRNGAIKPTREQLEEYRVEHQGKRVYDGNSGDYGWQKAASRHFKYNERTIRRIFKEK